MDLPTFDEVRDGATDTLDKAKRHGRTLIPWLPDPLPCPECGSLTYATDAYSANQACYVPAWECRECGVKMHRDPEYEYETPHPSPGSDAIRNALKKRSFD